MSHEAGYLIATRLGLSINIRQYIFNLIRGVLLLVAGVPLGDGTSHPHCGRLLGLSLVRFSALAVFEPLLAVRFGLVSIPVHIWGCAIQISFR